MLRLATAAEEEAATVSDSAAVGTTRALAAAGAGWLVLAQKTREQAALAWLGAKVML
jgi:hypothetical protein